VTGSASPLSSLPVKWGWNLNHHRGLRAQEGTLVHWRGCVCYSQDVFWYWHFQELLFTLCVGCGTWGPEASFSSVVWASLWRGVLKLHQCFPVAGAFLYSVWKSVTILES
jgi:hypothetical protein